MFANCQNANGWGEVGFFLYASEVGITHQSSENDTCLHQGHRLRLYKNCLRLAGEKINCRMQLTAFIFCAQGYSSIYNIGVKKITVSHSDTAFDVQ